MTLATCPRHGTPHKRDPYARRVGYTYCPQCAAEDRAAWRNDPQPVTR